MSSRIIPRFPPQQVGQPAEEQGRNGADPYRDGRAVDDGLPLEDDAEEMSEGDQGKNDNGERCEGFRCSHRGIPGWFEEIGPFFSIYTHFYGFCKRGDSFRIRSLQLRFSFIEKMEVSCSPCVLKEHQKV